MCPEILNGQGHDQTADLYCLGAFLFELLTGMPPFFSTSQQDLYKRIMNE
jgi:serine/threonine protein kinase